MANVFMVGIGKIKVFTFYAVLKSVIMAIGFFFFIKPFGIAGAGFSMLISCIVDIVFFAVTIKKYLNVSVRMVVLASYIKPILLAIIIGVGTYFMRPICTAWLGLIISCSTFVISYLLAGYLFRVLEDEKRVAIKLWKALSDKWIKRI